GLYVYLTTQYVTPGVVQVFCHPVAGLLDIGRYPANRFADSLGVSAQGAELPAGEDPTAVAVAEALTGAGFASRVDADVMRMKRRKLLGNLVNAIQIVCGGDGDATSELHERAIAEAEACFAAAGADWASWEETRARGAAVSAPRPVHGAE